MEVSHTALFQTTFQAIGVVGKLHAMLLHHIARTAHRGGSIVAMLGHLVSSTSHYKAGTSRDVERILSIPSRTHNVDGAIRSKVDG